MDIEILPNRSGAVLHGLDLSGMLSDSMFQDIYDVYLDRANIIITGQAHVDAANYVAFCARFGDILAGVPSTSRQKKYAKSDVEMTEVPKYTLPDHPEVFVISNRERQGKPAGLSKAGLYWHSDLYYMKEPAKVTFLLSRTVPRSGGDTFFLNSCEVFDALPEQMKSRARQMRVRHSWTTGWSYAFPTRAPLSAEECALTPDVEHPLVCRHPESGRALLYPGALYHFENPGIALIDSNGNDDAGLYDELKAFALSNRFIHRHRWDVGDILACDNLSAMHCATSFDDVNELRELHRVTIKGAAPMAA